MEGKGSHHYAINPALQEEKEITLVQVTVLSAFRIINVMCKHDKYTYQVKYLPTGEQPYIRYTLVKQQQEYNNLP